MNNTITEMKNALEGINSRITEAEERISDMEDRTVEIFAAEQNKEKTIKTNENSLRDFQGNIKRNNIRITEVPEEEKKRGSEKIFEELIDKNFSNMGKKIVAQVQEAQRVPYRMKPRRNMPRHILIKCTKIKDKEKNIKSNKGKTTNNIQGNSHKVNS